MTRWLVTGAHGQLGSDLVRVLDGHDVVALGRTEVDVADEAAVRTVVEGIRPDVIVNAAAYTAVDDAERDVAQARLGNEVGPANLARACAAIGAELVHVSTDYVFSGDATTPYREDAATAPRSVYGCTKLAGEHAVARALSKYYVVRTAWLYGETGNNFVKTMMRLERERETVSVVTDQRGTPTWSRHVASGLVDLVTSRVPYGTYHCTNAGQATWHDLARAVFEEVGADPARVTATTSDAYPRPAPRPAWSVLDGTKWAAAGLRPLVPWRDALRSAIPLLQATTTR